MKLRMKLLAHLETMRPYTVFHSGMLGFAAALFLSEGTAPPWRIALAFLVPTLGWVSGLYGGDYFDRDLDAVAKPHRPVPSGRISARTAFWFMVGYIIAGYVLALVLSPIALLIAVVTTVVGVAYSKALKRHALIGNFDRGLLAAFTVLFAGAAVHGLDVGWPLAVLCAMFFFHDSSSNLVGAIRDLEGDRDAGYRTVPVVYGIPRAVFTSGLLALAWLTLAFVLFFFERPQGVAVALLVLAALMTVLVHLVLLVRRKRLTRQQALGAHKVIVLERLILSAAVAAVFGPIEVVLPILAIVVVATQVAQMTLRNRYEFDPSQTSRKVRKGMRKA